MKERERTSEQSLMSFFRCCRRDSEGKVYGRFDIFLWSIAKLLWLFESEYFWVTNAQW